GVARNGELKRTRWSVVGGKAAVPHTGKPRCQAVDNRSAYCLRVCRGGMYGKQRNRQRTGSKHWMASVGLGIGDQRLVRSSHAPRSSRAVMYTTPFGPKPTICRPG